MKIESFLVLILTMSLLTKNTCANTCQQEYFIKQTTCMIIQQNEYGISTESQPLLVATTACADSLIWMISNNTNLPVYLFHFQENMSADTLFMLFKSIVAFEITSPNTLHTLIFKIKRGDPFKEEELIAQNLNEKSGHCEYLLSKLEELTSQKIISQLYYTKYDRHLAIDQKTKKHSIFLPKLFD